MLPRDPVDKLIYMEGYLAGSQFDSVVDCPYREGNFHQMLMWMTGYTDANMDRDLR